MFLPEGVRIEERATCPLGGNPDGVDPNSLAAPTFHIRNSVRQHFTSGYLTAEWERRTLQLLRIDISRPSDNTYPQSFSLSIQCSGVLLKLPDISDRYFEIFWDIF